MAREPGHRWLADPASARGAGFRAPGLDGEGPFADREAHLPVTCSSAVLRALGLCGFTRIDGTLRSVPLAGDDGSGAGR